VIENGKVAVWQLYVNPEPMVAIRNRIEEQGTDGQ
jgi:hypothetical protein